MALRQVWRDLRAFGPRLALHRWLPQRDGRVRVQFGDYPVLHLRPGTSDISVIRQIFCGREYELEGMSRVHGEALRRRYEGLLASGATPLIIDAGANIGAASVWFAHEYPKARIIAVEPEPGNAHSCRLNTSSLPNVEVVEAALGASPGHIALSNPEGGDWAFRSERSETGVRVVTIAELAASIPGAQLFIAKIDIEGFESDLFSENTGWLDEADAVMVEVHDWMLPGQGSSATLQRAMASRQFDVLLRGENLVYVNRSRVAFGAAP
jgi:FkbM family methyltransferase